MVRFPEVAQYLLQALTPAGTVITQGHLDLVTRALTAAYYVGRQVSAEMGDLAAEEMRLSEAQQDFIYTAMVADIPPGFSEMLKGVVHPTPVTPPPVLVSAA